MLGNIYLQPFFNAQELSYLTAFSSSSHFDNNSSALLGLYDISVSKEDLSNKVFNFNKEIDAQRIGERKEVSFEASNLFPFLKSPVNFTEKSMKFSLMDIQDKLGFIFFMEYLSRSILFYYQHFLKKNCHSTILDKEFFNFLEIHDFSGNIYFKLSVFGEMYRLTCTNEKIALFKGTYVTDINSKNYIISSAQTHEKKTQRQLDSFYHNLSIIDIKKNALFEEEGTVFSYIISEDLQKMLQFHHLNTKLHSKSKEKIHKI